MKSSCMHQAIRTEQKSHPQRVRATLRILLCTYGCSHNLASCDSLARLLRRLPSADHQEDRNDYKYGDNTDDHPHRPRGYPLPCRISLRNICDGPCGCICQAEIPMQSATIITEQCLCPISDLISEYISVECSRNSSSSLAGRTCTDLAGQLGHCRSSLQPPLAGAQGNVLNGSTPGRCHSLGSMSRGARTTSLSDNAQGTSGTQHPAGIPLRSRQPAPLRDRTYRNPSPRHLSDNSSGTAGKLHPRTRCLQEHEPALTPDLPESSLRLAHWHHTHR